MGRFLSLEIAPELVTSEEVDAAFALYSETKAPAATTDRTCASHTVCVDDQWESKAAHTHSDRECTAIKSCSATTEYQTAAPTATSDRVCAALSTCDYDNQWQSTAPTATRSKCSRQPRFR